MEGSKKYNQLLPDFPSVCQSPEGKLLLSCYLPLERQVSDSNIPDNLGINCLCLLSVGRHIPNHHPNSPIDRLSLSYSARFIYGIFPCMLSCHLWKTQEKEVAIKSLSVNSTLQGSGKTWAWGTWVCTAHLLDLFSNVCITAHSQAKRPRTLSSRWT